MPSIRNIAASVTALATVTVALPTYSGSSASLDRRTDCPAGSWYSVCNGYKGCFNYDPCSLPAKTTTTESTQQYPGTCASGSGLVYYNCANGYNGCFASDPCALPPKTATTLTPSPAPIPVAPTYPGTCPMGSGLVYYNCANGYKGCFSNDPCALPPVTAKTQPQARAYTECAAGTWFYNCANGYNGCYNYDVCSLPVKTTTTTTTTPDAVPVPVSAPEQYPGTCAAGSGLVYYNCANGYKGCFSTDPCALPAKPQLQARAYTECAAGTWFYNCANGYSGCYNYDVCSLPAPPVTTPVVNAPVSTDCPAGTWFYSCAAKGIKGCFDHDVC